MTVRLQYPFTLDQIRSLRIGDRVEVTGRIVTGRDRLHRHLAESDTAPISLRDGAIYHCGPVVVRRGRQWAVLAAGPTTSMREEPYMAEVMAKHGLRVIIGKGGMGRATAEACRRMGGVYLEAVGGAAQVLARTVRRVLGVHFLEAFGAAEAMWEIEVEGFPALVTMDTQGENLHDAIESQSRQALQMLLKESRAL